MGLDTGVQRARIINSEEVYWRKANHIHNWFVENFQEYEDDCRTVAIDNNRMFLLNDLKKRCEDVIKSLEESKLVEEVVEGMAIEVFQNTEVAKELLPTINGCFFGYTEYGELYLEQTRETLEWLKSLEDNPLDADEVLLYWSSW